MEPVIAPPFDDLSALPHRRLLALRRAARDLLEVSDAFAVAGRHPVREALATAAEPFTRWAHYPPDDLQDAATGYAWYYHAHDPSPTRDWVEHGHFHCFAYTELLPATAQPIALPADPDFEKGGLVHLVALCIDPSGAPMRLFTINRWLSNEWMYPAHDVIALVDRFEIPTEARCAPTSRWLAAMLRVLRPQMVWLLHERDRVLSERRALDPEGFSEDPALDVTSTLTFDLDAHFAAIERARADKARRRAA